MGCSLSCAYKLRVSKQGVNSSTQPNSWPEGSRGGHGWRRPASRAWSATWSASGASAGRTGPCAPRRRGRAVWLGLSSCAWPTATRGSWTARRHSGVWRRAAVPGGSASYRLPVVVAEERQQLQRRHVVVQFTIRGHLRLRDRVESDNRRRCLRDHTERVPRGRALGTHNIDVSDADAGRQGYLNVPVWADDARGPAMPDHASVRKLPASRRASDSMSSSGAPGLRPRSRAFTPSRLASTRLGR